jgi:hypothetical protein
MLTPRLIMVWLTMIDRRDVLQQTLNKKKVKLFYNVKNVTRLPSESRGEA